MKKIFIFSLLISVLFVACKKEKPEQKAEEVKTGIIYPETVYFNQNILAFPDSFHAHDTGKYEMGAILEKDAHLKIVMTNLSVSDNGTPPVWGAGNLSGWVMDKDGKMQKFISTKTDKIYALMVFMSENKVGLCRIDFYENSDTITKSKFMYWEN